MTGRLLTIALAVTAVACGDGTTEPPPPPPPVSAAGAWQLTQVGEQALPVNIGPVGDCFTITRGFLTLRVDASYEQGLTFHQCGVSSTSVSFTSVGTWNQDANLVDFVPAEGCADRAVVTATALRFARECSLGATVVYAR